MKAPLRILHLEDNLNDAALVQSTLESEGIGCAITRIQTRADFVAALGRGNIDLIIADFSLPTFDGLAALEITQKQCPEIPFILVSGTLGEETAVAAMQSGAADYLLKDRLTRLGQAVSHALEQSALRKERESADEAMQQSEHKYRHLFESLSEAAFLIDAKSRRILDANRCAEKLLGRTRTEILGMNEAKLFPPNEAGNFCEKLASVGTRGKGKPDEAEVQAKDGTTIPVRVSLSPIELYGRDLVLALMADVTERRQLEEQFIQSQKMEVVGHLAGGVAHDFNNILSVIFGYADLMMQKLDSDDPLRKYAEEVRYAGDRAAALTRQLLVFSRKEALQPAVLDPNQLIKGLDKMLRRLINENVELTIELGEQIGRINADSGYFGQVLMNLVVNARDALPNGGKILIKTSNISLDENYAQQHSGVTPGKYVVLSVTDNGMGMTEEVKAQLFKPFFTTKPKDKGTGLGLATCQTIVSHSGGHIGVESEVGKGATFRIYFPQVDQPLAVRTGSATEGALAGGTETLLLVEDDPSLRNLALGVLQAHGYEVLRAIDGRDGLSLAFHHKGSPIRLVITDVVMPQMGGKVMADWLKTTLPEVKVLFTSGYTGGAIAHHGVLDSDAAFLPKPYTPRALTSKVRELLDAPV
jgi:two-component system, cell cycle sensor histidine kinase and response regulator CckA